MLDQGIDIKTDTTPITLDITARSGLEESIHNIMGFVTKNIECSPGKMRM